MTSEMKTQKEEDHGAGLIHQTIPDMAGTEPRLSRADVLLLVMKRGIWLGEDLQDRRLYVLADDLLDLVPLQVGSVPDSAQRSEPVDSERSADK